MKVHRRNGGITPLVLKLGTKMEVSGQQYTLYDLTPRKELPVLIK
jgi:hypothetical protein